jgi:lysophospholipid acyltransferase
MSTKRYYDVASYFTTQLAFCFATSPFLILSLKDSLTVWARVNFYAVIGTAALFALFASPAKPYLRKRLEERNARAKGRMPPGSNSSVGGADDPRDNLSRTVSTESLSGGQPVLGLPTNPGKDFQEAVDELKREVEARQAAGKATSMGAAKKTD